MNRGEYLTEVAIQYTFPSYQMHSFLQWEVFTTRKYYKKNAAL